MKFDIEGRIRNMRLPDGKTALLYSVYEGVTNAIHAIQAEFPDRAPTAGLIELNVDNERDGTVKAIEIKDNGIGLNSRHLTSFETCDTLEKLDIGGRGVGRLVWFKSFDEVRVRSAVRLKSGEMSKLRFRLDPFVQDSLVGLERAGTGDKASGTRITLTAIKEKAKSKLTPVMLSRSLCHHFFPYFVTQTMPRIIVRVGRRVVDLGAYLASRMDRERTDSIHLPSPIEGISITHVYVDPKISKSLSNAILLTAQGRAVESIDIAPKFALNELEGGRAYVCVVSGPFLDEAVDQERTSLKATADQLDHIKAAALSAAEDFLKPHITKVRKTQRKHVASLLEEHPQLAISVPDVTTYIESLSPGMGEEDIGKSLFTLLYRHEKRVRFDIATLESRSGAGKANDTDSASAVVQGEVDALVRVVSDDAKRRLAEYTIKRHQIVQLAKTILKSSDGQKRKYHLDKEVHEIICPMGRMLSGKDYGDHNLWLIDDLLSYYQFFASDKSLASLGIVDDWKEPDLIFLNPFGFRREGTDDPIVVVEFKRPGDEVPTSDPVNQVLEYVERLEKKTVRGPEGEVIANIGDRSHFECIVVCDLTEGARKLLERGVAQNPTPDGMGYYGFSARHRASIRVLSYEKVFRDADMRNRAFFNQLGLLPKEIREALSEA